MTTFFYSDLHLTACIGVNLAIFFTTFQDNYYKHVEETPKQTPTGLCVRASIFTFL